MKRLRSIEQDVLNTYIDYNTQNTIDRIQACPKLCVLYTGALTTISMSKRTPIIHTYTLHAFPNFPRSAAMKPISVSNIFSNPILHFLPIVAPPPVAFGFLQCPT